MAGISLRLMAIAQQVPSGSRIVDVGTDHALLPIYLVQNGLITGAIATDIAEGPYQSALHNVQRSCLEKQISVRLGDGLRTVMPGEANVVVIAGMGGHLAVQILESAPEVMHHVEQMIVQPMNAVDSLRRYLHDCGQAILHEQVVEDEGRFYDLVVAHTSPGVDLYKPWLNSPAELDLAYHWGPLNLRSPSSDFLLYAKLQLDRWQVVLNDLGRSVQAEARQKAAQLLARIEAGKRWLSASSSEAGNEL